MTIYYINLDQEAERRAHMEEWFASLSLPGLTLARTPAVIAAEVDAGNVPGALMSTQKACILSHKRAIAASLDESGNAMILEDDAVAGAGGGRIIPDLMRQDFGDIDIIVTSALVINSDFLFNQYFLYRESAREKKIHFLDLKPWQIVGADSYIVGRNSKTKLLRLFDELARYDVPYDLQLNEWIGSGRIKALLAFPFLTTLSPFADRSQIAAPNPLWNNFRRLFSLDSELSIDARVARGQTMSEAVEGFTDDFLSFLRVFLLKFIK